ncbi:hypothetical protein [Shewanella sp. SG41-3]|uniref:hypothetical protein n=1 Tax=Shewanella sp. SG41-3 TaxID=2760977 RepID=UPI001602AC1F|nr:hypothetical protein [Shewanella sp. SG41-3]MBB1474348.1 hypothetical protein [Shewanella sp. SG41-3]
MSIAHLKQLTLQCNNEDDAILYAKIYAKIVTGHRSLIYSDNEFELLLRNKFDFLLHQVKKCHLSTINENLHIISTPYNRGGHTRLCERLSLMEDDDSHLLITQEFDKSALPRLQLHFKSILAVCHSTITDRILFITNKIIKYNKIILHIHPDDIVSVIAVGLAKKVSPKLLVLFVNHADHLFTYGRTVIDVMLQISFRGYEIDKTIFDKKYLTSFLGIPLDIKNKPKFTYASKNMIIAGNSFKMKPNKCFSIQKKLFYFLHENPESTLSVVGINYSDYWWWKAKVCFPGRVHLIKTLPYEQYFSVVKGCNICIDTAPVTGGTAFTEMYLNSLIPVCFFTGIYGYSPLDRLRLPSGSSIRLCDEKDLDIIFEDVFRVHDISSVKNRYTEALNLKLSEIDSSLTMFPNDPFCLSRKGKLELDFTSLNLITKLKGMSWRDKTNLVLLNFKITNFLLMLVPKVSFKILVFLNLKFLWSKKPKG